MNIKFSVNNIKYNYRYSSVISRLAQANLTITNSLFSPPEHPNFLVNISSSLSSQIYSNLTDILKQITFISSEVRYQIRPKLVVKNTNQSNSFSYITPKHYSNFRLGIMEFTSPFPLINGSQLIYKIFNYIPPKVLSNLASIKIFLIVIEGLN